MIYKRKYNKGGMFLSFKYDDKGARGGAPSSSSGKGASKKESILDDDTIQKEFLKGDMLTNEIEMFTNEWKKLESTSSNPFLNSGNKDKFIDLSASLVQLKNNKQQWVKAHEIAQSSGGLKEVAVGNSGELYVMDENSQVSSMSISNYKKNASKVRVLTVAELLEQRNSNPALIGQNNLFTVANNSIGIEKITSYARDVIAKIGLEKNSSERVYDRDTVMEMRKGIKEELQAGRTPSDDEVKGFAILDSLASSSSQHNLVKESTETQRNYSMKAVNYIWSTMDPGAKNKLTAQAALSGQEPTQLLLDLVQISANHSESSSIKPISVADASGSGSGSDKPTGKHMNNQQMMISGTLGTGEAFEFNDPEAGSKFNGITLGKSALTTPHGESIEPTTLQKVLESGWNQVLDINNVFFGNAHVDSMQLSEIAVDGRSEMGNVYLPVDPQTGGPDNRSLQLFRQAMDKYEELKDDPNITSQDIKDMFGNLSFDVTVLPDKSLDVRAQGGNVKPFWITFAYTNDASDLVKGNDDSTSGGLTKLSRNEHKRITTLTDRAFMDRNLDGSLSNIRPNKWGSERSYRGIVAIPLRAGAVANMDALVGSGPKKEDYSDQQVRYQAQNSTTSPFTQTNAQQLIQQ